MLGQLALVAFAATPNPYLEQAKNDFAKLEYARCAEHLHLAASLPIAHEELLAMEIYNGLCAFSLRREEEATEHFRLALKIDYDAELPPMTSPRIREFFAKLRSEMPRPPKEPLKPPDVPLVTDLKPPDKKPPDVVVPLPPPRKSRVVPIALSGVAVGAGGLGAYFGITAQQASNRSFTDRYENQKAIDAQQARDSALAANVSYAIAGAALVGAAAAWMFDLGTGSDDAQTTTTK